MINLFCIRPKGFNVGNDAIYLGMQHFIYSAFGEVVNLITLPATSRYESQAKAGLTSRTIYEINQYGHGVIIGGGNLFENGELDVQLDALGALEVPLMIFSVSRGRIYNRQLDLVRRTDTMPDRILKALDDRSDFVLLRDEATAAHMASIGCRNTTVGACPTIYLDRMMHRLPEVPGALGAARVLLLPLGTGLFARALTSPLKLWELLATDRPIVAPDLPSLREAAAGAPLHWHRPGDPDDIARAITDAAEAPPRAPRVRSWDDRLDGLGPLLGLR